VKIFQTKNNLLSFVRVYNNFTLTLEVDHYFPVGIHRKKWAFEPETVMRRDRKALVEQLVDQTFIDLMRMIFHSIRQRSPFDVCQADVAANWEGTLTLVSIPRRLS